MRLSDVSGNLQVVNDDEFATLGRIDAVRHGTLVFADRAAYLENALLNDSVSCILTTEKLALIYDCSAKGLALTDSPRDVFFRLHQHFVRDKIYNCGIEPYRGVNVSIAAGAVVSGAAHIGDNVIIGENVVVRPNVIIGEGSRVDVGCVLGCDGLLYLPGPPPEHLAHGGGVQIGKNVTLLARSVVVSSVHDSFFTTIGNNAIIGLGCNIGHEAVVGENCVFSSNCLVARGAKILDGAWLGAGSIIREYVTIGEGASVKLGSVVIDDVAANESVSGPFARDHHLNLLEYATLRRKQRKAKG